MPGKELMKYIRFEEKYMVKKKVRQGALMVI